MGENLALNIESRGYRVAVFNRTTSVVDDLITGRGKGKKFVGCHSIEELVTNLATPRKVMMMIKAGPAVDDLIEQSDCRCLSPGDVIIDGGNTFYADTERRTRLRRIEGAALHRHRRIRWRRGRARRAQHDARRQSPRPGRWSSRSFKPSPPRSAQNTTFRAANGSARAARGIM